jgi:AcrR family transcriptional regulator
MSSQKQDRRSQRTREALFNSLISLLLEKHYDEITVNEIIARANIGRRLFMFITRPKMIY